MKKAAAETTHTAAARLADANAALAPLLEQGAQKVAPFAEAARESGQKAAGQAREALTPAMDSAKDKSRDLLSRLGDALAEASDNPKAKDAEFRALAARAALRGELELPKKARKKIEKSQRKQIQRLQSANKPAKKGGAGKVLLPILLIAFAGVVGYLVWKKVIGGNDTEWQTYEPTSTNTTVKDSTSQTFGEPVDVPATPAEGAAAANAAVSDADPATNSTADASSAAASESTYGAGSYVGAEPPAGYTIKGNDRSKKYHTPDTGGYERTIADVWFADEGAAEAAGFTKAQR